MTPFEENYKRLNAAQRAAVNETEGPVMVIAGPGTGKTQLLGMRVANILRTTDTNPENILCLTFTEAAAQNMRERLAGMIGQAAYRVGIYTFHSFGSDIIQRYPEYFRDAPLTQPIDELRTFEILHEIFSNLPHRNPLSLQVNEEYLHLRSLQTSISWFKQAGLEPRDLKTLTKSNDSFADFVEPLFQKVFSKTPAYKYRQEYEKLASDIARFVEENPTNSLAALAKHELQAALDRLDTNSRYAKTITAWRNRWLLQDKPGHWQLADRKRTKILAAISNVYQQYENVLAQQGLYSFDDMIFRTLEAVQTHQELLLLLQEQYQYILVDEYQDTNGAQNQLLERLADSQVNEGKPNLMVVGDDDQAIYRFQGADYSVMANFVNRWQDVKTFVLTDNYRSTQDILDAARSIITLGEERLEKRLADVNKSLTAARTQPKGLIKLPQASTESGQFQYVADEINYLLSKGEPASSIAVLAPKHKYLQSLVPFLHTAGIPVAYERREHVLEQPIVRHILNLAKAIMAAQKQQWEVVDTLLPDIFGAEYMQLPTETLWNISLQAYRTQKTWLELARESKQRELQYFVQALLELARLSTQRPLEEMLDYITGNSPIQLSDETEWVVPLKQYYFSNEKIRSRSGDYLRLLGHLRSLREHLQDYRNNASTLDDLVEFVKLYEQSGLTLLDTSVFSNAEDAVQLNTAFKAKGLEWEHVFLLGCHEDIWGTRSRSSNYSFGLPLNLQWIRPARETADDKLRLFYVALTRAKRNLYLTCYQQKDNGKRAEFVSWVQTKSDSFPPLQVLPKPTKPRLIANQEIALGFNLQNKDISRVKNSLHPQLTNYRLSATHLNSYLDITRGGPRNMLLRNILHFPERLQPSAVYGLAIHAALHQAHKAGNKGQEPKMKQVLQVFTASINRSRLSLSDKDRLCARGKEGLELFLSSGLASFKKDDQSEYDFAHEKVQIDHIRLTGKLDLLRPEILNTYKIVDYKTGSPFSSWKPRGDFAQIRAHLYKHQLIFYKLMAENSTLRTNGMHEISQLELVFVEPDEDGNFHRLDLTPTPEDIVRTKKLMTAVWNNIMSLEFPDVKDYPLNLKGLLAFEEDLLAHKV